MAEQSSEAPVRSPGPSRRAGLARAWLGLVCVTLGLAFLLNPGAGVLELVPDTAPLLGNLDEAAATLAIVVGVRLAFRNPARAAGAS